MRDKIIFDFKTKAKEADDVRKAIDERILENPNIEVLLISEHLHNHNLSYNEAVFYLENFNEKLVGYIAEGLEIFDGSNIEETSKAYLKGSQVCERRNSNPFSLVSEIKWIQDNWGSSKSIEKLIRTYIRAVKRANTIVTDIFKDDDYFGNMILDTHSTLSEIKKEYGIRSNSKSKLKTETQEEKDIVKEILKVLEKNMPESMKQEGPISKYDLLTFVKNYF